VSATIVFYESPHRIEKALASLVEFLPRTESDGAPQLTKMHESYVAGTPAEVAEYFRAHPGEVRGEFVVIVSL